MTDMKYVRLFAGPDGETHFEDVAVELHPRPSAPPVPPQEASDSQSVERALFVSFPPGWRSEHSAPRRQFLIFLAGFGAIQTTDGEIRHFHAGDVLLAEDTTGKGHTSWIDGDETALATILPLRD
jgi:hypothetical protein